MCKLLFLFLCSTIWSQTNPENWVCKDAIGYDYYIVNNTLYKKNEREQLEYKNLSLGKLSGLDVKNPFQVVVIYKDFHSIILLDNFLNEIKKIDFFNSFNGLMIDYIATAASNKLWIKEKNNNLFYLFDLKTFRLQALNTPILEKIDYIDSDFNWIYYIDAKNKLFQMNVFGNIQLLFELDKKVNGFKINKNNLFYVVDSILFQINLETKKEIKIYESKNKIENYYINDNKIIIFANDNFVEIALK
jgi:hypothetical protein